MKSKAWRALGDTGYQVIIKVDKDNSTVSLTDNAPTDGGKKVVKEAPKSKS